MKGLQLAMGFLAGIALLATAASGVNVLRRPEPAQSDLVLVTGGTGPFWERVIEGAAAAARECGSLLRVETLNESNLAAPQAALFERLAAERHDGVAFCPVGSAGQQDAIGELSRSSKVLSYLGDTTQDDVMCRVSKSDYSSGKRAADAAIELLHGGGTIVALTPAGPAVNERLAGLDDQLRLRNRQLKTNEPAWQLVTIAVNSTELGSAARTLGKILSSRPRQVCVVSLGDGGLGELKDLLTLAGDRGHAKTILFDQSREAIEAIAVRRISAAIVFDPFELGHETIGMLDRLCRSEPLGLPSGGRGSVHLPAHVVDARNVERFRSKLFKL